MEDWEKEEQADRRRTERLTEDLESLAPWVSMTPYVIVRGDTILVDGTINKEQAKRILEELENHG